MPSSGAGRDEFLEYHAGPHSFVCVALYKTERWTFCLFRTADWEPEYSQNRGFANYARVAIHNVHLRPADPTSESYRRYIAALEAEEVQRRRIELEANGQRPKAAVLQPGSNGTARVSNQQNSQATPTPKVNGVKPPAKLPKRLGRLLKIKVNGADAHSLKPVKSIAGLTLADFLYDR